ncbi:MAG: hypothetical protein JWM89_3337, partial [Acidimicrobiales bacterium]|nr:hypothetical protein [Acidimicrobiales bacterium]
EAAIRGFAFFDADLRAWVRQSDEDGTRDRNQRNHDTRAAQMVQDLDLGWQLTAGCGSLQGAEMYEIWKRFLDAEWSTDWAAARAEHGDAATVDQLARTDAQRRMDALHAIFRSAADTHASAPGGSKIVTTIVIDHHTFERAVARLLGMDPDDALFGPRPIDTDARYRCSTLDGHPIEPTEAAAHALIGHIRRAVIGADSVIIDLGRSQRLFTGPAALAVRLGNTHCYWPGCTVPVTNCQIDHLLPWANPPGPDGGGGGGGGGSGGGGETNPHNGGPACGRHNRYKQHGYTVHRDPDGHWHTYRPDGTEIT